MARGRYFFSLVLMSLLLSDFLAQAHKWYENLLEEIDQVEAQAEMWYDQRGVQGMIIICQVKRELLFSMETCLEIKLGDVFTLHICTF